MPQLKPHILIDPAHCDKDGLCVRECPAALISFGPDGLPVGAEDAATRCYMCGHCIAVCPKAALTLAGIDPSDLPAVQKKFSVAPEAAEQFLRSRRSVRRYKAHPLDHGLVTQFIDTARYAPSGMNAQPVNWVVVEGRESMLKLAGLTAKALRRLPYFLGFIEAWDKGEDTILRGAPNLIVAHAAATGFDHTVDGAIALTYFELAAHAHGVGTCWAGLLMLAAKDSPELCAALGIPEGHQVLGALMAGYPKHGFKRLPPRNEAKVRWI
ncbi:MAG: nitroreductase [Deltaproteobacteria bacterium HGW-Deltaproteobacteria-8]|jgi:nitroreductase/NAD-dependent dihydropyrimidine dehydrogenase PreA subunit|nr:MAG: nitroreductase [Deltaproteobacteria bacterium HGW-Deltaproteobacteria-8]